MPLEWAAGTVVILTPADHLGRAKTDQDGIFRIAAQGFKLAREELGHFRSGDDLGPGRQRNVDRVVVGHGLHVHLGFGAGAGTGLGQMAVPRMVAVHMA